MLGKALNVLRNRIRVKYEKNVLRIKRSLLTQVTLLAENLLPEVAALLSSLLQVCGHPVYLLQPLPPLVWDFPSSSKEKGQSVGLEELNQLVAKVRSLKRCYAFKLIASL